MPKQYYDQPKEEERAAEDCTAEERSDTTHNLYCDNHDVVFTKTPSHLLVELLLPSAETRNLHLYLVSNCLLVGGNYSCKICQSEFVRLLQLPMGISHENIRAVFKSQTLSIKFKIPKNSQLEQVEKLEHIPNLLRKIVNLSGAELKTYIPVIIQ
jgi:HSP20 family molecular chaperone IbpA